MNFNFEKFWEPWGERYKIFAKSEFPKQKHSLEFFKSKKLKINLKKWIIIFLENFISFEFSRWGNKNFKKKGFSE